MVVMASVQVADPPMPKDRQADKVGYAIVGEGTLQYHPLTEGL